MNTINFIEPIWVTGYNDFVNISRGGIIIRVQGNIDSLKRSVIEYLESLDSIEYDKDAVIPLDLCRVIAGVSCASNREIAVFLNRKGAITSICIGDFKSVNLPEVKTKRNDERLTGIRCIHTHPNASGELSDVDLHSLLELKLDAMIALGTRQGEITDIYCAFPNLPHLKSYQIIGPVLGNDECIEDSMNDLIKNDKAMQPSVVTDRIKERAILVGVLSKNTQEDGSDFLDELEELAKTAGAEVVLKVHQKKDHKDAAFYIGRGKLYEIAMQRQVMDADIIIFDDELSGAQIRNIEEVVGVRVVDRTALILDIFASRAISREGKLQVELAQLKYRMPRLVGMGVQLSRLGGGIGTRGPGEKKLEVDRRHIRRRINYLESEIEQVGKKRETLRKNREVEAFPIVSLVGYTNAGKSSILNCICGADVYVENKLFSTLDHTSRGFELSDGRHAIMVDTVGFIKKLPHDLIDAFRSTLEEVLVADVLLHIVDASSKEAHSQIKVVHEILNSIGAGEKPIIIALNKRDKCEAYPETKAAIRGYENVETSVLTKHGINSLLELIGETLPNLEVNMKLSIPYSEGWVIPYARENGKVINEEYTGEGTIVEVILPKAKAYKIEGYKV